MNESTKYLAELARQLDNLKNSMADGEIKNMSPEDLEQILGNIRDLLNFMEQGLDVIATELEGSEGIIH